MGIYHVVLTPFRKIGLGMRIDTICLNFQHFFMASWQHYIKLMWQIQSYTMFSNDQTFLSRAWLLGKRL